MRVDSHLHVNFKGLGVKQLISYMDREKIDQCWLLTWEEAQPPNIDYQHLTVQDIYEAYEKHPSRIVPMYAPDPNRPDAANRFMQWHDMGIRGCGELKVALSWDSPKLDPLLSCLDRLGLPLIFHMEYSGHRFRPTTDSRAEMLFARLLNTPRYNGVPRKVIDAAARWCRPLEEHKEKMRYFFPGYLLDFALLEKRLIEFPNIKFIGHGPMFWKGFASRAEGSGESSEGVSCRLLAEYDNLYADLSAESGYLALIRDPGFTRSILARHSKKMLYGTDNFFLGLRAFLDSLGLPGEAYKRIYGENACELLAGNPSCSHEKRH